MAYKTFEDMKHDIPEGATHYHNETATDFFAWVKLEDGDMFCLMPDSAIFDHWHARKLDGVEPIPKTETPEEKEAFDSMANGEKPASGQDVFIAQMNTLAGVESQRYFIRQYWCNSGHQNQLLELGILFTDKDKAIEKTKSLLGIPTETPQQREERERLESAYDLYLAGNKHCIFNSAKSFDEFKSDDFQLDFWLTIVDKTGYRKESK